MFHSQAKHVPGSANCPKVDRRNFVVTATLQGQHLASMRSALQRCRLAHAVPREYICLLHARRIFLLHTDCPQPHTMPIPPAIEPPTNGPCLEQVLGGLVDVVAHVVAHLRDLQMRAVCEAREVRHPQHCETAISSRYQTPLFPVCLTFHGSREALYGDCTPAGQGKGEPSRAATSASSWTEQATSKKLGRAGNRTFKMRKLQVRAKPMPSPLSNTMWLTEVGRVGRLERGAGWLVAGLRHAAADAPLNPLQRRRR